jgi:hypothetical protein
LRLCVFALKQFVLIRQIRVHRVRRKIGGVISTSFHFTRPAAIPIKNRKLAARQHAKICLVFGRTGLASDQGPAP